MSVPRNHRTSCKERNGTYPLPQLRCRFGLARWAPPVGSREERAERELESGQHRTAIEHIVLIPEDAHFVEPQVAVFSSRIHPGKTARSPFVAFGYNTFT